LVASKLANSKLTSIKRANQNLSFGMLKKLMIATGIMGTIFITASAQAQERLGDGAMGALAGALVGGPVGLVAGGVVGYTAGPAIASSWGLKRHRHSHHAHYRHRSAHRGLAKPESFASRGVLSPRRCASAHSSTLF